MNTSAGSESFDREFGESLPILQAFKFFKEMYFYRKLVTSKGNNMIPVPALY